MASTASPQSPDPEDQERHSVLAELPHTRPQRPSARRESARKRAGAKMPAQASHESRTPNLASKPKRPTPAARPRAASKTKAKSSGRGQAVKATTPPQGYEADGDLTGTPVAPPSGTEVLGALAELAGELAHTGITAGGRLLRGAFSRLSGS